MTIKREDLDMTTIVERAFQAMLDATAMPGTIGMLPAAKKEQMKRAMIAPIHYAIPVILEMLEEKKSAQSDEEILASFTVPDSLDGLLPDA